MIKIRLKPTYGRFCFVSSNTNRFSKNENQFLLSWHLFDACILTISRYNYQRLDLELPWTQFMNKSNNVLCVFSEFHSLSLCGRDALPSGEGHALLGEAFWAPSPSTRTPPPGKIIGSWSCPGWSCFIFISALLMHLLNS